MPKHALQSEIIGKVDQSALDEHEGTPHSDIPKYPAFVPANIGALYNGNGLVGTGNRTTGTALDSLVAGGPLFSGEIGITIDRFDINVVTLGAAGAIYRAGLWIIDNQDNPFKWSIGVKYATLLGEALEGGSPFDVTSAGVKTRTLAVPLEVPPEKWFIVGGVSQVAVCQPTIGSSAPIFTPYGQANAASGLSSTDGWLRQTGVSSALSDFTPNAIANNVGHGVGFRRSA